MKKYIFTFFLLIFTITVICSLELNIKVIDKDIEIPLEGVKVEVSNSDISVFTDKEGKAKIILSDEINRAILTVHLIGYEPRKIKIENFKEEVIIGLSLEGVLEGNELVIEEESIDKKDEKVGVSTVIDENELKSTAEIGLIEDVLSTIKTLPGVTYSGGFDRRLAIRGGHPDEFTTLYDGFLVRYPYHWGGMYSIFNPNIVESAKFSNGVFSVKNGFAMSGLLEVESVKPDEGFKFEGLLSTSTLELFLQAPVGLKNAGLFVGGRISYYDLEVLISDSLKDSKMVEDDGVRFSTAPYIRDAYLKWFWKPNKRFEWYVNGFFASDGVGVKYDGDDNVRVDSDINILRDFKWENYDAFGVTGFKILPNDKVFMHILTGYEFLYQGRKLYKSEEGTSSYSDDFEKEYNGLISDDEFKIEDHESNYYENTTFHSIQSRFDTAITLHERVLFNVGTGGIFDFVYYGFGGKVYGIVYEDGYPVYKKVSFKLDAEDKSFFKSFLYFEFEFDIIKDKLDMDLGCRLDHSIVFSDSFENGTMNTYPVPSPRFNVHYTPVRNLKYLDHLTLSAGIGLFSKVPFEEVAISGDYGIKDFDIPMPKVVTNVLGIEVEFPHGFKIKIEGYYKYYFNRFYFNYKISGDSDKTKYYLNCDGIGHAAGFDIMFQRKLSRYIDGWITYSFIYARYLNPSTNGLEEGETIYDEPRGRWYYPTYHRFHNLNFILNIRPFPWFTITSKLSFASGRPKKEYGDKDMFATVLEDGTVVEMYSVKEEYSDTLRTDFSIPFDLKFAFNFFFPKSKVKFEAYIGVEDLFVLLYSPEGGLRTNKYTGEQMPEPENYANYSFPMPSAGIKIGF
jgi:hypothetical protein